jgi:hypothetical protein
LQEFINLLENPESGLNSIQEEIADGEKQIVVLQRKIAAGDKTPATGLELIALQAHVQLMKQRVSKDFNENVFFKDPKYMALSNSLGKMKGDLAETKRLIADLDRQMTDGHCPRIKKTTDEITEIDLLAAWRSEDPKNKGTFITLSLNGSGASTTGSTSYPMPEGPPAVNKIFGCKETAPNKLLCNYTSTMEDEEAYIDMAGTVELILTPNTITSNWKESSSAKVRWKGKPRDVTPIPPRSYTIVFKKG